MVGSELEMGQFFNFSCNRNMLISVGVFICQFCQQHIVTVDGLAYFLTNISGSSPSSVTGMLYRKNVF
jgi:hypothetical protein